ncbi:MAG: hypothetical protein PHU97_01595 [Bacteroidales bacterium]|nr:hypothetical protein [Bacteroidales bacterium]MDD2323135.1 hypothetical protein [Bacteroidales bacterium]MDD3009994.1 hypothetical protein [Bacteroidales bacterium]
MKHIIIISTLILLFWQLPLKAQEERGIEINGFARNYTGVLTGSENEFSIIQNTFNLSFEKKKPSVGFKVNPYLYHYFDRELELGLREAYLDLRFDNLDLRIGKQQIIYGKADGVFITDVVSPKDLREFLLPDFEEIRMGVTAVKANYYFGNNTIEAVWVPLFTPTQMPGDASIWKPEMPYPVMPSFDYSTSEIIPRLENSELFLRFSSMASKADFELVGGYFWADDPALHLTKQIDPVTMQLTGLTVRPDYHRLMMGGGSIGIPIGPIVLRSEGGYYSGKHFQTAALTVPDATIEKDYLHYMIGVDYTLAGIKLSTQFIQENILSYEEGILNDQLENTMTFLAKKDFLRERLWIELFAYTGLKHWDALIRPKISWLFADGFDIQVGANIFTGDEGRFGQYHENTMVYSKIKYSF